MGGHASQSNVAIPRIKISQNAQSICDTAVYAHNKQNNMQNVPGKVRLQLRAFIEGQHF